jgi:hypothetical protein
LDTFYTLCDLDTGHHESRLVRILLEEFFDSLGTHASFDVFWCRFKEEGLELLELPETAIFIVDVDGDVPTYA